MKAASVAIWTAPFTNDKLTCEDVVFAAAEGIGLGRISLKGIEQIPMNAILIKQLSFLSSADEDELKAAFEVGKVHADAVNEARTLSICLQIF